MLHRVGAAYVVGLGLVVGGIVVESIGLSQANTSYCGFSTACDATTVWLVFAGGGLIWLGLAVAVAAYGRSKSRPFFPMLVAALSLGCPICLLALAVTTRLDVARQPETVPPLMPAHAGQAPHGASSCSSSRGW